MENKDEILKQLREFERQRNSEVKELNKQIQAIYDRCSEESRPFRDELNQIAITDTFNKHGIKEGDVIEVWHGQQKKQTRNIRIDAIVAEPYFCDWGESEQNIVNYRIIGTHIKKDGSEGERSIDIYEGYIVKRDKQAANQ